MNYHYLKYLPVYDKHDEIIDLIRSEQVIIVSGETGCGKTTQLPLFCLEAGRGGNGRIGCTQPRRVAAQSLARFVATLFDPSFKESVGYKVRFQENIRTSNKIKFMTDGILLAEVAHDPMLREYDTLIIDEIHERTVNIDLLLGYLRILLSQRPEFRLILSSATINTSLFSKFFNSAPVVQIPGRLFDVHVQYKPVIELWKGESIDSYIEGVIYNVNEIIQSNEIGDVLVFLPTVDDVYDTIHKLPFRVPPDSIQPLALHSRISYAAQKMIFESSKKRKVIVATNVAETSITVPGIRFVIDSGLSRVLRYDPKAAISRMPIEQISRSSAEQRAGRCGRVQDGVCIRLYSEQDFLSRPRYALPEIKRANCAGIILRMYKLNAHYVKIFSFVQSPSKLAMSEGYRSLRELGAIDRHGNLSSLGNRMAELPLDPSIARMLLYSIKNDSFPEVAVIASALSVDRLMLTDDGSVRNERTRFNHYQSDFMTFLNVWYDMQTFDIKGKNSIKAVNSFCEKSGFSQIRIREWINIHTQIVACCKVSREFFTRLPDKVLYEKIHKSLLTGMPGGVAFRCKEFIYEGVNTGNIRLFPGSTLFRKNPQWVLCHEIVETGQVYGRYAAVIKPQWIESLFRKQCRYIYDDAWYDIGDGIVKSREEVVWKGLTIFKNRVMELSQKDREKACALFIKDALVNEAAGDKYRFIIKNREMKKSIFTIEQKLRKQVYGGDILLESFYEERLKGVCSRSELQNSIKEHGDDSFLIVSKSDLMRDEDGFGADKFPDYCSIAARQCRYEYLHSPDSHDDGVTIHIDEELYNVVPPFYWDWVLPVLVQKRVEILMTQFNGTDEEREQIIRAIQIESQVPSKPFLELVEEIFTMHDIGIQKMYLNMIIPEYLWVNVKIHSTDKTVKYVGRAPFERHIALINDTLCDTISALLQRYECLVPRWQHPALLQPLAVQSEKQAVPLCGYPALFCNGSDIVTRVFLNNEAAYSSQLRAVEYSIEQLLSEELAWCTDSIHVSQLARQNFKKLFNVDDMEHYCISLLLRYVIGMIDPVPQKESELDEIIVAARKRVALAGGEIMKQIDLWIEAVDLSIKHLNKRKQKYHDEYYKAIHEELSAEIVFYISAIRSETTPFFFLERIPIFVSVFLSRIDTALYDYKKYCAKVVDIQYLRKKTPVVFSLYESNYYQWIKIWRVRYLIEEFIVAHFSTSSIKPSTPVTLDQIKILC